MRKTILFFYLSSLLLNRSEAISVLVLSGSVRGKKRVEKKAMKILEKQVRAVSATRLLKNPLLRALN